MPSLIKSSLVRVSALGLSLAALSIPLTTPAGAVSKAVERACRDDYKRLCPAYKPTSPQLRACMESKANEITPNCVNALVDSGEVDKRRVQRK